MLEYFDTIKQQSSIKVKIIAGMSIVMAFVITVVMLWTLVNEYHRDLRSAKAQSTILVRTKSVQLQNTIEKNKQILITRLLTSLRSHPDFLSAKVFNDKGKIIAFLDNAYEGNSIYSYKTTKGFYRINENITNKQGKVIGTLIVKFNKNSIIKEQLSSLKDYLIAYSILFFISFIFLYWFLSIKVIDPITRMVQDVRTMAREGLHEKIHITSDDDIGVLASAINSLTMELLDKHKLLDDKNKQLETTNNELIKAKIVAEDASKIKSDFIKNISHKLKDPLGTVINNSEKTIEILSDKKTGRLDLLPDLFRILTAAKYLISHISDILDISNIESGNIQNNLEHFKLLDIINIIEGVISPIAQSNNNKLQINLLDKDLVMYTDMVKLKQSLLNLLDNAAKFTKDGNISMDITLVIESNKEWVKFVVKDTGVGIDGGDLARIFAPFTQTSNHISTQGVGLGLAITKNFCGLIGGNITVESEKNKGTIFTMVVPKELSTLHLY